MIFGLWRRVRAHQAEVLMWSAVAAVVLIPLAGLLQYAGPPMEEGFMLVFPERLHAGDLPHVDFLHLYGPGSLWFLSAIYGIFGTSLLVERMVALVWNLAIVAGATTIGRQWNRTVGFVSGAVAVVITLTPTGLTALAWNGAVALGVWGAILGARSVSAIGTSTRTTFGAGLALGVALLFRPDLAVAVCLVGISVWWLAGTDVFGGLIRGVGLGVSPMLLHLGLSGPLASIDGMLVDPVFRLRGGRSLPRPPSWSSLDGALQKAGAIEAYVPFRPPLAQSQQVVVWFFIMPLAAIAIVAVGAWSRRRYGASDRSTLLIVTGAFAVGLLPQALQRPDSTHLAWVGCVVFSLLPAALYEAARRATRERFAQALAVVSVPLLFAVVLPSFSAFPYVDITAQGFGMRTVSYPVVRNGRQFNLGTRAGAEAAQMLVDDLDRRDVADVRLFVGTADLRFTPYSDAFFYFLFPEATPATRFIEMDPGIANSADSGLADEIRGADILILSHFWDVWVEPNESMVPGSDRPNQVVAEDFCLIESYRESLELYERCSR